MWLGSDERTGSGRGETAGRPRPHHSPRAPGRRRRRRRRMKKKRGRRHPRPRTFPPARPSGRGLHLHLQKETRYYSQPSASSHFCAYTKKYVIRFWSTNTFIHSLLYPTPTYNSINTAMIRVKRAISLLLSNTLCSTDFFSHFHGLIFIAAQTEVS